MARKKLTQVNGKVEKKDASQFSTLDQVWGDTGSSKYGTLNEDEYQVEINEMTRSDVELHAAKQGIMPGRDLKTTRKRLMTAFKQHVSAFNRPASIEPLQPKTKKEKDKYKAAMSILSEGR
jgi:hypothetical protein